MICLNDNIRDVVTLWRCDLTSESSIYFWKIDLAQKGARLYLKWKVFDDVTRSNETDKLEI
jgi:hypothetical protein